MNKGSLETKSHKSSLLKQTILGGLERLADFSAKRQAPYYVELERFSQPVEETEHSCRWHQKQVAKICPMWGALIVYRSKSNHRVTAFSSFRTHNATNPGRDKSLLTGRWSLISDLPIAGSCYVHFLRPQPQRSVSNFSTDPH